MGRSESHSFFIPVIRAIRGLITSLRHVQPEVGKQIGARDQAEEFVALHYNGDPAAIEYA